MIGLRHKFTKVNELDAEYGTAEARRSPQRSREAGPALAPGETHPRRKRATVAYTVSESPLENLCRTPLGAGHGR